MNVFDIFSAFLFLAFCTAYLSKLVILKRRVKINANVLARGGKEKSIIRVELFVRTATFFWLLTWVVEMIFSGWLSDIVGSLFHGTVSAIIGLILIASGTVLFTAATIYMKNSWRVGIDKDTKTSLIREGVYRYSRNPAFVGFDLMFAGVFVSYANILTLFVMLLCMMSLHTLILQEEKHLLSAFGQEYSEYAKAVPRYFLITHRLKRKLFD